MTIVSCFVMSAEPLKTKFAPAERLSDTDLMEQVVHFENMLGPLRVLDAIPDCTVVLNQYRQIVCANKRFCELAGANKRSIVGKRLGEILNCLHSCREPGGCGTSEYCSVCGAVGAMLRTINDNETCESECNFTTLNLDSHEFHVTSTPYDTDKGQFVFFSLRDISQEKRREAMEQVFFHDLLNTAGGMRGMAELVVAGEGNEAFSEMVLDLADEMIDEIKSYQMLSSAEEGHLEAVSESLHSEKIMEDVQKVFANHDVAKEKHLNTLKMCDDFEFISDGILLKRVLINMVKNAFEASDRGKVVILSSRLEDGNAVFDVHNNSYIERKSQLQIFQRSFSTKGRGRGLGSYSSRLLGEKYLGGKVSFKTSREAGTTFTISLPLVVE